MGTCHGCRLEGYNPDQCGFYEEPPKSDAHRRSPGFHEAIHRILLKHLNLQPGKILRMVPYYFEPLYEDKKGFLVVEVEVKMDAFVLGDLSRKCEGDIGFPDFFLGYFRIGETRYNIWREHDGS